MARSELVSAWAPAISISSPAFGKPMTFDFWASVVDVDMPGTSLVTRIRVKSFCTPCVSPFAGKVRQTCHN